MELYDELLELVLAYSNRQVKQLAAWIIEYKKRDDPAGLDLRLEKKLYVNRFRRMAGEYGALRNREREAKNQEIFEFYSSYIKSLIPNKHRFALDELCFAGSWKEAAETLVDIDEEIEANKFEHEYDRLVVDTGYLIEQLVIVMKKEYTRRVEISKKAMAEYLNPHGTVLKRLERNLADAQEQLWKIAASGLSEDDKRDLERILERRIKEMEEMKRREGEKLRRVKLYVDEIEKTYAIFEDIIASIEKEKDCLEERKKFASFVRKLEIETKEIDEVFASLSGDLERNVQKAKETMYLLTHAFQGDLATAINDQERINRILESDADAEGQKGTDAGEAEEAANKDYYEDILKILKSMNK